MKSDSIPSFFLGFAKVCTQVLDVVLSFIQLYFRFKNIKMFVSQNANIFMEYNDTMINMCECSASVTSLVVLIKANQCDNFESIIFINYAIDQCEKATDNYFKF